ncbi:hypothetical protein D9611_008903 [Ephemerocybe angulata]|uniref:ASX DEUBAD domain-containing protein n=1 Tax=Ephemerocybe angulata TaxID=980116 RepID=A0A8H5BYH0_9AGAR|nr:hypothetical protein D9611_008903 [Tulosesus angulatus]
MSDRPRRSTRQAAKGPVPAAVPTSNTAGAASESSRDTSKATAKRKSQAVDPEQWLNSLFQNPKSILTTIDISDVFNSGAWGMLSDESRGELKKLLPPTAFVGYKPTLGRDHPASQIDEKETDDMDVDGPPHPLPEVDVPTFFTDPHFLAAARTFQDHIYSNWLSDTHIAKVAQFNRDLESGAVAVSWKDEQWLEDNPPIHPELASSNASNAVGRTASWNLALAGGATQIKLAALVEHGIIRIGDVLAYRRSFTMSNLTIEKDVIVDDIDPSSYALTVLAAPGATKVLPQSLLAPRAGGRTSSSTPLPNAIQTMTVASPTQLEGGLLDIDGRFDKSHRPNGNAWKNFSVWRWRTPGDGGDQTNGRGGRDNHGTLFYLRGNYYHEEFRG